MNKNDLVYCQSCSTTYTDNLQQCPKCDHPNSKYISRIRSELQSPTLDDMINSINYEVTRNIIKFLLQGEKSMNQLLDIIKINGTPTTQPNIAKHLEKIKKAGILIESTKSNPKRRGGL